jgi:tetratricopeptide (TPR) repeat protein
MNKTINFRYLLRLSIVVGVVGAAVLFVHGRQASKQADAFLHQADEAEKKGNLQRMVTFLSRYLALKPDDSDTRARMGFAMARVAVTHDQRLQAFLTLERVLRDVPDREDVRRQAIRLAIALGLYTQAKDHLTYLIKRDTGSEPAEIDVGEADWEFISQANSGDLFDLYAQCIAASTSDYLEASRCCLLAIKLQPALLDAFARRAALLRHVTLNRPEQADEAINQLVALNPYSANAWLLAASYAKQFGHPTITQDRAIATASKLAPDDAQVLLAAASLRIEKAIALQQLRKDAEADIELENARRLLENGIEKNPTPEPVPNSSGDEHARTVMRRNAVAELYRNIVALEVRRRRLSEAEKWARRGASALPEQPDLILSLADALIRQGKTVEATEQLDKLRDGGYIPAVIESYRARILALNGEWLKAINHLRPAALELVEFPASARQAYFLLAECYEHVGELDLRHEALQYSRPSDPFDPLWVPARVGLAATLADMGRTREAIKTYEEVLNRAPAVALPLARLLSDEEVRRPEKDRNWTKVEQVLDIAPKSVEAILLRAEMQMRRGDSRQSERTLDNAKKEYADQVSLWVACALLAEKEPKRAEQLLKDAEAKFGDQVAIRLVRARLVGTPLTAEGKTQLTALAEGINKFSVPDRRRLLNQLSERAREMGALDIAAAMLDRLAVEDADNLAVQFKRFDRAIQGDDEHSIRSLLAEIRRIDGEGGSATRLGRAMHFIWRAERQRDASKLEEAKQILIDLERKRSRWARPTLSLALVYELLGEPVAALNAYRKAVEDHGVKDPQVIGHLAQMYADRQDFEAADELLTNNSKVLAGNQSLLLVAAESSFNTGHAAEALKNAEKAVSADSKDPRKLLWLGRMRWLCGKRDKDGGPEEPFRKAVELDDSSIDAWLALIQYLCVTNRRDEAEELLATAEKRIKKEDVSLALAISYEALGRPKEAREWYDKALKQHPTSPVLRSAANFLLRHASDKKDEDQAWELLDQILKLTSASREDQEFARNLLAVGLSISPDYDTRRKALKVVGLNDLNRIETTGTVAELRSRAQVLSLQPGRHVKQEALRLLGEIEIQHRLRADDQFLMAQMQVVLENLPAARTQLSKLVASNPGNPLYLSYYIRFLLVNFDAAAEARPLMAELEKLEPESPRVFELQFRLLMADKKNAQAVELLRGAIKKHPDTELAAARLLENFKEVGAAEALLQKIVADSKSPRARLILAEFYARQNRNSDAISELERGADGNSPAAVVTAALTVLYSLDEPRNDDIRRARLLIERSKPNGSEMLMEDAALRNLEGDYAGTIAVYRKVLERHPANVLAMNNLAFLLAFVEKKHADALKMIQVAKSRNPAQVDLADTEAMILLDSGKARDALKILDDAAVDAPKATTYFHIAWAYDAQNLPAKAKAEMAKAKKLGLRPADVQSLQRPKYQDLLRNSRD